MSCQYLLTKQLAGLAKQLVFDLTCSKSGCHLTADCCAQTCIELDDGAAAAMAELLKSMRGDGAVGTTTLECRRMTPATMRDIQRVNTHFPQL